MTHQLIDTHAHLDFPEFDNDRGEVLERAQAAGVTRVINIGSTLDGSERSVALSKKYENVFAAVGVHPHDADGCTEEILGKIRLLAKENEKVVAIGETGLDYFKNFSSVDNQRKLFASLISLAKELELPLVIHCRQAQEEVIDILTAAMPVRAVVHCFSGDEAFLKQCLDLDFYTSFTCNITYKKADGLRQVVKAVPLEKLMLETDAPYLSPEGMRGKRNDPSSVRALGEFVAALKGVSFDEIADATTANAEKFFRLPDKISR